MQTNSGTSESRLAAQGRTKPNVAFLGRLGIGYDSRSLAEAQVARPFLDNRFGIVQGNALRNLEDRITPVTIPEALKRLSHQQTFGLKQVQIAHKEIFDTIYPWAGQLRRKDISKDVPFLPFELIKPKADRAFTDFRSRYGSAAGLGQGMKNLSPDGAAVALAGLYSDLNHIHPFREGNGRSNRAVVTAIGRLGGYDLDWTRIADRKTAFDQASMQARTWKTLDPLADLFRASIVKFDPVAAAVCQPESRRKLVQRLRGMKQA